jgi:hypothetical protein
MVTRNRFEGSDRAAGARARARGGKSGRPPSDLPWAALKKAWRAFGIRLPEMRDDLSCYVSVQTDRVRLAGAQFVTRVASGLLLVLGVAAVFAIAVSFAIGGIAGGLAAALDGKIWLADLITGTAAIVALCAGLAIYAQVRRTVRMRRLEHRYERHAARQRAMAKADVPNPRAHAERS